MKVATIGHAVCDENGRASGGKPGDQTGKEVRIAKWYCYNDSPWIAVFRAKSTSVRKKLAKAMVAACNNDNIGYNQAKRTTLYNLAKANGWQLDKVGLCETDCSALVAVCVNAAGITVSKDMYTGNELDVLKATSQFKIYTSDEYCKSQKKLKKGDILLKKGHTAMVVKVEDVYKDVVATKYPAKKDEKLAGIYKVTADALNMRNGAGASNSVMTVVYKDQELTCDGSYSESNGTKWMYVSFITGNDDVRYTGFCSSKYLKLIQQ